MKEFSAECFVLWSIANDRLPPPFFSIKKNITPKNRLTQKYKTNRAIYPVYEFSLWKERKELILFNTVYRKRE